MQNITLTPTALQHFFFALYVSVSIVDHVLYILQPSDVSDVPICVSAASIFCSGFASSFGGGLRACGLGVLGLEFDRWVMVTLSFSSGNLTTTTGQSQ
jgi:hypothetical protein